MAHPLPTSMDVVARGPLTGSIAVPGDKSISHRALMFASLAVGTSRIEGSVMVAAIEEAFRDLHAAGAGADDLD